MWKNGLTWFSFLIVTSSFAWGSLEAPNLKIIWTDEKIANSESQVASNLEYLHTLLKIIEARDVKIAWENPRDIQQGVRLSVQATKLVYPSDGNNVGATYIQYWKTYHIPFANMQWSDQENNYLLTGLSYHLAINYRKSELCGAEVDGLATISLILDNLILDNQNETAGPIVTYSMDVNALATYGKEGILAQLPVISDCSE